MDDILVRKAQKGDRDSFCTIVMQVKDQAYHIAYSYLHNEADSMDAVCNAVEKAYIGMKKLQKAQFFNTWFIRIVINECKQLQRKNMKMGHIEDIDLKYSNNCTYNEESIDLEWSLQRLESVERTMIYMKYYWGYTLEEISGVMQIPVGTVKTKIYSSLKDLKSKLECKEV